jgi:hypothetical protein
MKCCCSRKRIQTWLIQSSLALVIVLSGASCRSIQPPNGFRLIKLADLHKGEQVFKNNGASGGPPTYEFTIDNPDANMPFVGRHVMFVELPDKTYNNLNEDDYVDNPRHVVLDRRTAH